jgi:hypothetical protein
LHRVHERDNPSIASEEREDGAEDIAKADLRPSLAGRRQLVF